MLTQPEVDGSRYIRQNLSTRDLMSKTVQLSVNQLGALSTLIMIKKIVLSGKPTYISDKLETRTSSGIRSGTSIVPIRTSLNINREGFRYQGTKLFNQLPENLRNEEKISQFKN